jgi:hypothetical protein
MSLIALNPGDGDRDGHKLHIYIVVTWEDIAYTRSDQDIRMVQYIAVLCLSEMSTG